MINVIVTLCTCPDRACADKIARHLVECRLAACVNILPQVTSIYRWQGQIETSQEQLLLIKSNVSTYHQIESAIQALHPYDIPEILSLPVVNGLPEYTLWIDTCHTAN